MRKLFIAIGVLMTAQIVFAQTNIDSLEHLLANRKEDANLVHVYERLSNGFFLLYPDSSYIYGYKGMALAKKIGDKKGEAACVIDMGESLSTTGDYPKALDLLIKGLKIAELTGDNRVIESANSGIAEIYENQKDYNKASVYQKTALSNAQITKDGLRIADETENLGSEFSMMGSFDSAINYLNQAYSYFLKKNDPLSVAFVQTNLAEVYFKMNMDKIALEYYRQVTPVIKANQIVETACEITYYSAMIFQRMKQSDSAIYYGTKSLALANKYHFTARELLASDFLASFYDSLHKNDSALKYLKHSVALKDSLFNQEKNREVQNMTFNENIRQQEIADQKKKDEETAKRNLQLIGIAVFIPIFFLIVLFLAKIKVKPRVVEFLGLVILLLFFEFITDLIYPYVSNLTNEQPIWEMLTLVILAALLEPLNFKLEHWVKKHVAHRSVPVVQHAITEEGFQPTHSA